MTTPPARHSIWSTSETSRLKLTWIFYSKRYPRLYRVEVLIEAGPKRAARRLVMQENGSVNVNGMPSDQASSDRPRMAIEPSAVTECRPPASADIFPGVGFRIRREITRPSYDAS